MYTSNPNKTDDLYIKNGAGILTSREFGFGVMDAEAMVTRARHWINVPPQLKDYVNSTASGYIGPQISFMHSLHLNVFLFFNIPLRETSCDFPPSYMYIAKLHWL